MDLEIAFVIPISIPQCRGLQMAFNLQMKRQVNLNIYLCSNFISLRKGCNEKEIVLLLVFVFDTLLSISDIVNKCGIVTPTMLVKITVVFSCPCDDDLKKDL